MCGICSSYIPLAIIDLTLRPVAVVLPHVFRLQTCHHIHMSDLLREWMEFHAYMTLSSLPLVKMVLGGIHQVKKRIKR